TLPEHASLTFFVLLDVPGNQAFSALAALVALLPVLLLDAASLECVVDQNDFVVLTCGQLYRGNQYVFQSDLGVFDLLATSLAYRHFHLAQVLAAGAMLHDCRSSLVDAGNYMQVVKAGLAQTTATATGHAARLVSTPRKGR